MQEAQIASQELAQPQAAKATTGVLGRFGGFVGYTGFGLVVAGMFFFLRMP